jgi:hypothetical protein
MSYCQNCGLALDITIDKVQESFVEEAAELAVRRTEERCRFWLLAAATAFAAVLAARLLLVPDVPEGPALAPYVIAEGAPGEAAAGPDPVEPLPIDLPPLDIPRRGG